MCACVSVRVNALVCVAYLVVPSCGDDVVMIRMEADVRDGLGVKVKEGPVAAP